MTTASPYGHAVLAALQGRAMYAGTVPHAEKQDRRRKNRMARASRKQNRKR